MAPENEVDVAVIGGGVVGCAVALALARRGAAVALLEAEPELALGASGTNSGILHTGFDSPPGELETELILASGVLRDPLLDALAIPVLRCGALMQSMGGALEIPAESVTDPVVYTLALAAEAERHGAEVHTDAPVDWVQPEGSGLRIGSASGAAVRSQAAVNCAGLGADSVAGLAGDKSFSIYPRKGEFLVFDPPGGEPLEQILMPVHTKRTRGVLVFPTIDGKIVAGPTAVDLEDKRDWSVRSSAREEIVAKAAALHPPLAGAEPVFAYAGLRPAGRDGANYLIGPAVTCPRLINVAAIRSTGLSASLGIAEHVIEIVRSMGVRLGPEAPLIGGPAPEGTGPWWRRTAEYRAALAA